MSIKSKTQLKLDINANEDFTTAQRTILTDTVDSYANAFPMVTTTQRNALTPTDGLTVYNVTTARHEYWDGNTWNVMGNSASVVSIKRVVITGEQMRHLTTTPITLFEAPGPGYMVAPVSMFMRLNYLTEPFDFAPESVFFICDSKKEDPGERIGTLDSDKLNSTVTCMFGADNGTGTGDNPMVQNDAVVLCAGGDGATQGNSSLTLYIVYSIIPY